MSRKHLSVFAGLLLFSPLLVFAAYNDVSLGTSAAISVNSVTMTVTSSDSLQSMAVGASSFSIVILPGSRLDVSASGPVNFNLVVPSPVTNTAVCDSGSSTLAIINPTNASATTIIITPSSVSSCTSSSSSSSTGGNGSPGGGGGGSAPAAIVPQITTTVTPTTTQAVAVSSMKVPAVLTRVISVGSKGADVKVLQQILNSDPDTMIATKGAGSPGNETTLAGSLTVKAIQKFQTKYGIIKRGQDGYGTLGPKTRAKLNELYMKQGGAMPAVSAPAVTTGDASAQASQLKALQDALASLKALQSKTKGY